MTNTQYMEIQVQPQTIEIQAVRVNSDWDQDQHITFPKDMVLTEVFPDEYSVSAKDYPILLEWLLRVKFHFPTLNTIPIVDGSHLVKDFNSSTWYDKILIADSLPFKLHKHTQILLTEGGLRIKYDRDEALAVAKRNVACEQANSPHRQYNVPVNGYSWEEHYKKYGDSSAQMQRSIAMIWQMLGRKGTDEAVQESVPIAVPAKEKRAWWRYAVYAACTIECLIVFGCWVIIGKIIVSHLK